MKMFTNLTEAENNLLGLIKQALFNIPMTEQDTIDWDVVYNEARSQAIAGLIADCVPDMAGSKWKQVSSQNMAAGVRYLYAQDELISIFQKEDIPLVILKGCAAAVYYPKPMQRSMGDIDFLVPQNLHETACLLMQEKDYSPSSSNNPNYTRHKGFEKNGLHYELHHHFSYEDLDIEKYIIEGLKIIERADIEGFSFPMLPKLANGLVLLAHMRNHLQTGLGLRQVLDWMMYVDKELSNTFWESEFHNAVSEVGMETLAVTVTRMCQLYLGLREDITWCKDADESLCRGLLESLLSYGNFGRKHGTGNQVETVTTRIKKHGLFRYLQSTGEYNWKAFQKHKWLKPFCWFYQICHLARKGFQSGRGTNAFKDINSSKERNELLKELGIF